MESEPVSGVRHVAPTWYAITSEPEPRNALGRGWRRVRRVVFGRPLPSRLERVERLGVLAAIALIGSDMIASSVYGPDGRPKRERWRADP